MLENLRSRGRDAYAIATADEIVSDLAPRLKGGEIVVIMSNGSFDGIYEKLLSVLRASEASADSAGLDQRRKIQSTQSRRERQATTESGS